MVSNYQEMHQQQFFFNENQTYHDFRALSEVDISHEKVDKVSFEVEFTEEQDDNSIN